LVYLKPSVPEESEDEIRTSAEASKAAIDLGAEVADAGRHSIAQVLLDIAMTSLFGIQIGGVGRKPVHFDLRMCAKILLDHRRELSGLEQPAGFQTSFFTWTTAEVSWAPDHGHPL
jgi:hypothetical protein